MYNFYSFVHTRATVGWLCVQFDFLLFSECCCFALLLLLLVSLHFGLVFVVVHVAIVSNSNSWCCDSAANVLVIPFFARNHRRHTPRHTYICTYAIYVYTHVDWCLPLCCVTLQNAALKFCMHMCTYKH